MATNSIGSGTRNISINVPVDERDLLGKVVFAEGLSVGELVRKAYLAGLDARTAQEIREIRRKYYGSREGSL